jgi:phosphate uptake regulator
MATTATPSRDRGAVWEKLTRSMLERTVQAFLDVDISAAQTVMNDDACIDQLCESLLVAVMADMNAKSLNIESGVWLLHADHCLER